MNLETRFLPASSPEQEAQAALRAITEEAKTRNLAQLAQLSAGADAAHVAEHIRSMVAVTMGHLPVNAPTNTQSNAEHWRRWALGVADGVGRELPEAI